MGMRISNYMFRRDFELLNEAYITKICELNLGPGPQDGPSEGLSPEKRVSVVMPKKKIVKDGVASNTAAPLPSKAVAVQVPVTAGNAAAQSPATDEMEEEEENQNQEDENCEECGGACGSEVEDTDSDTYMAKQLIYRIFKLSSMLYPLMKSGTKVEAWVLDKISKAHNDLNSVFNYKDFESFKSSIMSMGGIDMQQEETEIDLYNAINKGGDDLINNLKALLKKESRETKEKIFLEVIQQLDSQDTLN